ncbi:DUF1850 domain-containing protein [Deferrisoma palaeochoriense]
MAQIPARPALRALAGLFAAGLWAWAAGPGGVELTVVPVRGGPPLWTALLDPGERFTIHYVHSVDRKPIWEVHAVDAGGRIFVEDERFVMIGAGMGDLPGRGRWTGAGGLQVIEGMHYPVGQFVLRVGSPGVDHTIEWRGTAVNLSARAAGEPVRFTTRPVDRLTRWVRAIFPPAADPRRKDE